MRANPTKISSWCDVSIDIGIYECMTLTFEGSTMNIDFLRSKIGNSSSSQTASLVVKWKYWCTRLELSRISCPEIADLSHCRNVENTTSSRSTLLLEEIVVRFENTNSLLILVLVKYLLWLPNLFNKNSMSLNLLAARSSGSILYITKGTSARR